MKKILVPVDFSDVSKLAAEFAVDLAERSQAEIIFLHSSNYNDYLYGTGLNLQSIIDDLWTEEAQEYFDDDASLKKFIAFALANSPFGIMAERAGLGPGIIKAHKITASEVCRIYKKSLHKDENK